ncbi:MAG TPA: STAS domain-containing protein [Terriglobia bacterium]|nr:STAS domain-containing protein [Terriglobia bacterium]
MRIDVDLALVNPKPHATSLRPSKSGSTSEPLVVMHLSGVLGQGPCACFFLEQIRLLTGRGIRNFVINLLNVEIIDTQGVGSLSAAYNFVRDTHGRIKYVFNSKEQLSAIRKDHLDKVFEIFQDEDSALASF